MASYLENGCGDRSVIGGLEVQLVKVMEVVALDGWLDTNGRWTVLQ